MNCQQIYKILLKKTKNQSENIQKSFREATFFLKHPLRYEHP